MHLEQLIKRVYFLFSQTFVSSSIAKKIVSWFRLLPPY